MTDIRAVGLATFLTGITFATQQAKAEDSHAIVAESLTDNLVGKATLDEGKVTGVQQLAACITEFKTANGSVRADWSAMDNFAPRLDGRYVIIPLQHDGKVSDVRMPDGKHSNRVWSSFTLLYTDCHRK